MLFCLPLKKIISVSDAGGGQLGSTKMQRGFWWLSEIISSCILKPNRSNFSPEDNFVWQLDCECLVYLCSHFQVGYKKRLCELFSSKLHSVGLMGDNINMYVQSLELYSVLAEIVLCGAGVRRVGRNKKIGSVMCLVIKLWRCTSCGWEDFSTVKCLFSVCRFFWFLFSFFFFHGWKMVGFWIDFSFTLFPAGSACWPLQCVSARFSSLNHGKRVSDVF